MTSHLTSDSENYLKTLYLRDKENGEAPLKQPDDRVTGELIRQRLARQDNGTLTLTKDGLRRAELVIRRHRLAERLLHDIVDVREQLMDRAACEFEHSLLGGIDEQVCTLLGHPRTCPHGRPIPPGRCCREKKKSSITAVLPLSEMKGGEVGTIAYLASKQSDVVQKLMVMGVLPGARIRIIQTFPSVALQVGQTQMAIDESLAHDVYIRRTREESRE